MTESRIISIGGVKVGVIGLDQVLEEMAAEYVAKPDAQAGPELLARLKKLNYIPPNMFEAYTKAFVREFRRSLGQPVSEDPDAGLEIRVLGQGCPRCQELYGRVMRVAAQLNLKADLEHVTELQGIATLGGASAPPVLAVNGDIVSQGKVLSEAEIKEILQRK